MTMRDRFLWACVLLIPLCSFAQPVMPNSGRHPGPAMSVSDRMRAAAQIHTDIDQYFAHWQGVPDIDFDANFDNFVSKISSSSDRRVFDFAALELFASLKNGHTKFFDSWLWKSEGQSTGLAVEYSGGHWIVINSRRSGIEPGTIIEAVDGQPIDKYFERCSIYISGSDDRARRDHLFNTGYLFGKVFTLTTSQGHLVRINRFDPGTSWRAPPPVTTPQNVVYTRIENFEDPSMEERAIDFVRAHSNASSIIIDVRGNGGGTTPAKLLDALVTEPYLDWSEASAMSVGLLKTYGEFLSSTNAKTDPEDHGFVDGMHTYFSRPMMYWPGILRKPGNPIYVHRLIVLIDRDCASACEDFVMPLKVSHRATLIGERTFGSSGQPFKRVLSDEMSYQIGAKRMFFGSGAPFEGIGIEPDIPIDASSALGKNVDPVLQKAVQLAK